MIFSIRNFQANFSDWRLSYLLSNCPQTNLIAPYINNGSGNGLVPPVPQPMLTKFYVAILRH